MNYKSLGTKIGIKWDEVDFTVDQFKKGLADEMGEHHDDEETKVINTTEEAAKIAWAHLKEDPKYYDKLEKILESIHDGTTTADDLNYLIEATPECVRDRVRRRTLAQKNRNKSHQTDDGHAELELPTFADRVQPKRERSGNTQMHGRGKSGHRHSVRTQKRKRKSG